MEAENINVEEYVFQLDIEEEKPKEEESEETRSLNAIDINLILASMLHMSTQMSQMSTQISTQISTRCQRKYRHSLKSKIHVWPYSCRS